MKKIFLLITTAMCTAKITIPPNISEASGTPAFHTFRLADYF